MLEVKIRVEPTNFNFIENFVDLRTSRQILFLINNNVRTLYNGIEKPELELTNWWMNSMCYDCWKCLRRSPPKIWLALARKVFDQFEFMHCNKPIVSNYGLFHWIPVKNAKQNLKKGVAQQICSPRQMVWYKFTPKVPASFCQISHKIGISLSVSLRFLFLVFVTIGL